MKFDYENLKEILVNMGFNENEITQEISIGDDLGLDSTEMVDLETTLCKQYKIDITHSDILKLSSVAISEFVTFVNEKCA